MASIEAGAPLPDAGKEPSPTIKQIAKDLKYLAERIPQPNIRKSTAVDIIKVAIERGLYDDYQHE